MYKSPKVLLLLDARAGYSRGLLHGIARYSHVHQHWLFNLEHDQIFYKPGKSFYGSGTRQKALDIIKKFNPDGIIMGLPKLVDEIIGLGIPLICHTYGTETIPGVPTFASDNFAIAKLATEYFLSRGFKNFAYCGEHPHYFSVDRGEKYREILSQTGFEANIFRPSKTGGKRSGKPNLEQQYIVDWVKLLPKPVAILTSSDDQAVKVISACYSAKISVPEQVVILGIDNDELLCDLSGLPLSSIALNSQRAGFKAAELLDKLISGEEKMSNQQIILRPTRVITRRSTDIIAIEDDDIATAVRFIRDNSEKMIGVSDVAAAASMSRRNLQRRFQAELSRAVIDEIKRVKILAIKNVLEETNFKVANVAYVLGLKSTGHLSKYFKRETGMTPGQYRKKFGSK